MSGPTKQEIVKTLIEKGKLTRLDQLFPNVYYKTNWAKDMHWNPSDIDNKIKKAELFDMKTVKAMHELMEVTPGEAFLLTYNQYMHNNGGKIYTLEELFKKNI